MNKFSISIHKMADTIILIEVKLTLLEICEKLMAILFLEDPKEGMF